MFVCWRLIILKKAYANLDLETYTWSPNSTYPWACHLGLACPTCSYAFLVYSLIPYSPWEAIILIPKANGLGAQCIGWNTQINQIKAIRVGFFCFLYSREKGTSAPMIEVKYPMHPVLRQSHSDINNISADGLDHLYEMTLNGIALEINYLDTT